MVISESSDVKIDRLQEIRHIENEMKDNDYVWIAVKNLLSINTISQEQINEFLNRRIKGTHILYSGTH